MHFSPASRNLNSPAAGEGSYVPGPLPGAPVVRMGQVYRLSLFLSSSRQENYARINSYPGLLQEYYTRVNLYLTHYATYCQTTANIYKERRCCLRQVKKGHCQFTGYPSPLTVFGRTPKQYKDRMVSKRSFSRIIRILRFGEKANDGELCQSCQNRRIIHDKLTIFSVARWHMN